MRVAVCGSVTWVDEAAIAAELDSLLAEHGHLVVLTGMADGADEIALRWAQDRQLEGKLVELRAECLDTGDYPGPMHAYNERLLTWAPDRVVAFKAGFDPEARRWGHEPGTEHLIRIARDVGIETVIYPPLTTTE